MDRWKHVWLGAAAAGVILSACGGSAATPSVDAAAANMAASAQAAAPAAVPADPARLSATERAAIMQAAGYRLSGTEWRQSCDGPAQAYAGEITRLADMNGDGRPEAVVEGGNSDCFGATGSGFAFLTSTPAGWRELYRGSGLPDLHPRPGIAFPDIEIGGPGASCFRFLRWNGSGYVTGGTSEGGRICDLRVTSAAMPLPVGYYVQEPLSCGELTAGNPAMIGYLGRDRFVQVTSGTFVSFRKTGPDRYSQTERFPSEEGGPGAPQATAFTVNSDSSFRLYDREDWTYCPLDQVPRAARFLDSPDYRTDPRIRAVRGR